MPLLERSGPTGETAINYSRLVYNDFQLPQGLVNWVVLLRDPVTDRRFVRKTRRENGVAILKDVDMVEYTQVGFDGIMSIRSFPQQYGYIHKAAALGLGVATPVDYNWMSLVYPYSSDETLKKHLKRGETAGILPALTSVYNAHRLGMRHGDRWAKNILVGEDSAITHIDFDVAVSGKNAKEFELAQLVYDISSLTTQFGKSVAIIGQFAQKHSSEYDWRKVGRFIEGYESFYSNHPVGKIWMSSNPVLGDRLADVISALNI